MALHRRSTEACGMKMLSEFKARRNSALEIVPLLSLSISAKACHGQLRGEVGDGVGGEHSFSLRPLSVCVSLSLSSLSLISLSLSLSLSLSVLSLSLLSLSLRHSLLKPLLYLANIIFALAECT